MYAGSPINCDEDFFSNNTYSKSIECVFPNTEMLINFRINGSQTRKYCFVYAEKMDYKGLIQLRLTEKSDSRKMYVSTVNTSSFHELKQDQSLHVTFAGFIENLINILKDCQNGKLEIILVQDSRKNDLILQFYEMRTFKNLTHLCLPIQLASLNVVLFYINRTLEALQTKTMNGEETIQSIQHELNLSMRRVEQLEIENIKLKHENVDNSKLAASRHKEEILQMQESIKQAIDQKHMDNERNRKTILQLQSQLEKISSDKNHLYIENSKEIKKNETLQGEISALKSNIAAIKEQNEKLVGEISSLQNLDRKNEMHLSDSRKHITDLQDKLNKYDKLNSNLIAELEAEKKICKTKRHALELSVEEIAKANKIIAKQSQELKKLNSTISWRTEVALQQEKVIKENNEQIRIQSDQLKSLQKTIDELRKNIPQQLESMQKFANEIESKYCEKIRAISQKLLPVGKENYMGSPKERK